MMGVKEGVAAFVIIWTLSGIIAWIPFVLGIISLEKAMLVGFFFFLPFFGKIVEIGGD